MGRVQQELWMRRGTTPYSRRVTGLLLRPRANTACIRSGYHCCKGCANPGTKEGEAASKRSLSVSWQRDIEDLGGTEVVEAEVVPHDLEGVGEAEGADQLAPGD